MIIDGLSCKAVIIEILFERNIYMKSKAELVIRIDDDLLRKATALAEIEGQSLNNHVVALIRQSVQYHERVHGKIDVSKAPKEEKL